MKRILVILALLLLASGAEAQYTKTQIKARLGSYSIPTELAAELAGLFAAGSVARDNNVYVKYRNAAGSANIDVLKVDATDDTVLNADSGDVINLSIAGTSAITIDTTGLFPTTDGNNSLSNLGTSAKGFKNAYLSDATNRAQLFVSSGLYVSYPTGQDLVFREASTDKWAIKATSGSLLGGASSLPSGVTSTKFYVLSDSGSQPQASFQQATADAVGPDLRLYKTRNTNGTATTVVNNADVLFKITGYGSDGTNFINGASIQAKIDNTPGTGDMPTALYFYTTPDSSSTLTQALVIDDAQNSIFAGQIRSSRTTDIGWSVVAGANTACNTTCTSACVLGWDTGTSAIVNCASALADNCVCAGAS